MIITRTPFRISFSGGGTDLKEFYTREEGAVLSSTIDKYIYVIVSKRNKMHESRIRVSYSVTENAEKVEQIKHPIVREALKLLSISEPIEVAITADIPAKTGLGSSSSFAVGLLHALHTFKNEFVSPEQLAREACHIEIDRLKRPIGKQDHYAAAYGGINYIQFLRDGSTLVNPLVCDKELRKKLFGNLMMFYTNMTRDSSSILAKQRQETSKRISVLKKMRDIGNEMKKILQEGKDLSQFGFLLDKSWQLKKQVTKEISNSAIDGYYEKAKRAGALGGKILGAGGGGFLLLYADKQKQDKVRQALKSLLELDFGYEPQGSKIIYIT